MALLTRDERTRIARRRLINVLKTHTVSLGRTLEQKISDAGPYNQRIDPHILTESRRELIHEGRIVRIDRRNTPWFHLNETSPAAIKQRIAQLEPVHQSIRRGKFTKRVGQALEIAIYRALLAQDTLESFGRFHDLENQDDSRLYRKEEPPSSIGNREIPGQRRLDFLVRQDAGGWAGIEAKNLREWLYVDRLEIKDLLQKCLHLDAVPVLIGRRIPYVTRRLLTPCGVILWETLRQHYPATEHELAAQAKDKNLLGFHDIVLGNDPSPSLMYFIAEILPQALPLARECFNEYRDLLHSYVFDDMPYDEFAARIRRREAGENEDSDWKDDGPPPEEW